MQIHARKLLKVLSLILAWYILSTCLSLYNKKTVGKKYGLFGNHPFPAPLLMSSIQFACQTGLAKIVFLLGLAQRTTSRRMPWSDYFRLVVPNGFTTGLDIGFSNTSLVFIDLAFYTMCKATVPVFLLFFAFVWGIEKPSLELIGVVVVIVGGLALLVKGETHFDLLGFGLVMTASCLSGLRFTLTQVLLHGHQNSAALGGPLEVLEQLTPIMSITALLFSLAWEELWNVLPSSVYFNSVEHAILTTLAIALGALIAFLMVWTEYQVIKETSALVFMIAGTVKEVVTVLAAVIFFGEKLTWINVIGLVIVMVGVLLFNYHKYRKLKATPPSPRKRVKQVDGATYAAVEASEDSADGESKPLRRPYGGSSGGVSANGGLANNGSMSSPVPAAAAGTAVATVLSVSSSPQGTGGGSHGNHQAVPGVLSRAIAGLLTRAQGGGATGAPAAVGGSELSPLLPPGGGSSINDSSGYRSLPMVSLTRDRDRERGAAERGTDVEGMVVGVGNAGGDPAVAIALSGAGISGPQRATRPGSRGLLAAVAVEGAGEGAMGLAAPHQPLMAQAQLLPQAPSPQLR
ncbi:hypothetical protein Vretimale_10327 [Volvox reticuliferus]|uniref:Sugar phosphate transporter domain-containing protein n=1 Tax=Volvox reticuliferus TaxID=1737510 RepID=A0A8J4GED6_9CHLO|nr:hypothetical protein Vretifemale_12344 [Volvox reticuliferus]GIM05949.1 hypothetical protein Vretimale_10327 [Volvox reticuliferus]